MKAFQTSREIAAAPDRVFDAFSDPKRAALWWGPAGFKNTFEVFEFKKGGRWNFVMHGPDGRNYPNSSVFADIVAGKKVVVDHISEPKFRLTVEFQPSPRGTLVLWNQAFADPELAKAVEHIVVPANEQNLDRLTDEVLKSG